jgi:hypothetical protein
MNIMSEHNSNRIYVKGTIIILAVHINNDEKNYNELIRCIIQLRNVYKEETIVAVDNESLNKKWYEKASELNIVILKNNSDINLYEPGAYRLALQHYRADKYVFLQCTIFINAKLNLSMLDNNEPNAVTLYKLYGLHWTEQGLKLINDLLQSINMNTWNNDPLVVYNCFCCNDLFAEDMINSGLLNLPSNTKNHSCAFERIFGSYIKSKIGDFSALDQAYFHKIHLFQNPHTI